MSDDQATEIKPRKVGFPLGAGIFFLPFIFAWFTLRKGYGRTTRFVSLGWMGLGIAFWVLAAIGSSNITPTDKADAEAPTDAGAEAKAKSVNDDTSNDKLAYDYGKCLVVYQNGASNIYLAIKDGRISKDSENKMLYNFNRKQAAYWGYKSAILSAEYSDKNKFEKLSNQFLNEKVMPIINDANALAELFKPLYIECKVPSEDFAAFAAEVRRTNPDPSDEDPVGTFATQFKQPPLD